NPEGSFEDFAWLPAVLVAHVHAGQITATVHFHHVPSLLFPIVVEDPNKVPMGEVSELLDLTTESVVRVLRELDDCGEVARSELEIADLETRLGQTHQAVLSCRA